MSDVFNTLKNLYPELDRFSQNKSNVSVSGEFTDVIAQSASPEPTKETEDNVAENLTVMDGERPVLSNMELPPLINNSWITSLNKITSVLVAGADNEGQLIAFVGVSARVGSTTVSYYASRLLASYNLVQANLFFSLKITKNTTTKIFQQLIDGEISIDAYFSSLDYYNFSEINFKVSEKIVHSAQVLHIISLLLKQAKKNYHWIVTDMPITAKVPNFSSLYLLTNGVIVVTKSGKTRVPAVNALVSDLQECGANVLGAILNYRTYPIPKFLLKLL